MRCQVFFCPTFVSCFLPLIKSYECLLFLRMTRSSKSLQEAGIRRRAESLANGNWDSLPRVQSRRRPHSGVEMVQGSERDQGRRRFRSDSEPRRSNLAGNLHLRSCQLYGHSVLFVESPRRGERQQRRIAQACRCAYTVRPASGFPANSTRRILQNRRHARTFLSRFDFEKYKLLLEALETLAVAYSSK